MEPGIASALIAAAKKAREARGIDPAEMAVALKRNGPGSVSKVSRFENGKQYAEFDRTLSVYSELTGRSLLQLLKDAEEHIQELRRSANGQAPMPDPNSPAGKAVAAAKEAERKAKARQRASRRRQKRSG